MFLLNPWNAREASHHAAFMGNWSTIIHTFLVLPTQWNLSPYLCYVVARPLMITASLPPMDLPCVPSLKKTRNIKDEISSSLNQDFSP